METGNPGVPKTLAPTPARMLQNVTSAIGLVSLPFLVHAFNLSYINHIGRYQNLVIGMLQ